MKIIHNQFELAVERINHPYFYLLSRDFDLSGNNYICFIKGSSRYKDDFLFKKTGLECRSDKVIGLYISNGIKAYLTQLTRGITAIKYELNYLSLDIDNLGSGIIRIIVAPDMLARFLTIMDDSLKNQEKAGREYLNSLICTIKEKMKP